MIIQSHMIHGIQNANYLLTVMNFSFRLVDRTGTPNINNNIAIFGNVNVEKYFCEMDGYRYPKEAVLTNFPKNDYLDQYREKKLFYKNMLQKN